MEEIKASFEQQCKDIVNVHAKIVHDESSGNISALAREECEEILQQEIQKFWGNFFFLFQDFLWPSEADGSVRLLRRMDSLDACADEEGGDAVRRLASLYRQITADTMFPALRKVEFEIKFRKEKKKFRDDDDDDYQSLSPLPFVGCDSILESVLDAMPDGEIDHSFVKFLVEEKGLRPTPFCYLKAFLSARDMPLISFFRSHEEDDEDYHEHVSVAILELYQCVDIDIFRFKIKYLLEGSHELMTGNHNMIVSFSASLDFCYSFVEKYDIFFSEQVDPTTDSISFHLCLGELGVFAIHFNF